MMHLWNMLTSSKVDNDIVQILMSLLIGLAVGAEREYRNKSAGLRTFVLISFGACLFTMLSLKIGTDSHDRIAANIITGIGFLGAGVIFKDDNKVGGITTASTIWATAALGMCVGSGHLMLAFFGVVLVWFVLHVMVNLQRAIDAFHKIIDYTITVREAEDIAYCEQLFCQYRLNAILMHEAAHHEAERQAQYTVVWRLSGRYPQHSLLIAQLRQDSKIDAYHY